MDQAKLKKRLNDLRKVKSVVEIAKIDTIKKISRSNNIKKLHYEIAKISQQIINYSRVLNKIVKMQIKQRSAKAMKTLWIFVTFPSSLLKTSYSKHEKIIEKKFKRATDKIIAVSDVAIDFCERKNYDVLTKFEDLKGTNHKLSSLIVHLINKEKFNQILIVSQASKSKDGFYKLYPFEETKYDSKKMSKRKFFYSLSDAKEQIFYNYIKNIVGGIYQESYWNYYADKLAKHETSLNNIDEKIVELKSSLVKDNRKKETEEMIHIIQTSKRR